ncbi:PAS domain-containing protein [Sphingomonas sp. MA1305]|uniref:PAS domain-containing protein n=1 Tax=Sphingomonas sp. MA1305 TaxID=2479204 RepID=UPI003FA7AD06
MDTAGEYEHEGAYAGSGAPSGASADPLADLVVPPDAEIDEGGVADPMFDIGGDERRMHVRAYNHWVSLLKGRPYPAIDDLDPGNIADFGPHSVLLDFSDGLDDPSIAYLGRSLREECGLETSITRIADVPGRSLLSRLTDHYLQIIANRAPIGFEAEFVGTRGRTTLYRGILMPFSSDGDAIDFIYGVINWKEMVDQATQATLDAELDAAIRAAPRPPAEAPVWADGPSHGVEAEPATAPAIAAAEEPLLTGTLGDRLMIARESAAAVRAADTRGRAALYRALSRAHDFALACQADPEGLAALLAASGLKQQPRAPLTPLVKLVFGADYDKTRLAEYAAVLGHAQRATLPAGGLMPLLEATEGGVKALVAAERAARRPVKTPDRFDRAAAELRALPVLGKLAMGAGGDEFVLLLARAAGGDTVEVIKRVDNKTLVASALKKAAG